MEPDPDVAFLRRAVEAGLLSPAQAEVCRDAVASRPTSAAVVAVEQGFLAEPVARRLVSEVARSSTVSTSSEAAAPPRPAGWGASVVGAASPDAAAPGPSSTPDLSWDARRPSARARTTSERLAAPDALAGSARFRAGRLLGDRLRLVLEEGGQTRPFEFDAEQITIGRTADNPITISDPLSSRHHCRVRRGEGGGWVVEDLDSRNGTRLNGELLTSGRALGPGDRIEVGDSVIHIGTPRPHDEDPSGPTERPLREGGARDRSAGVDPTLTMKVDAVLPLPAPTLIGEATEVLQAVLPLPGETVRAVAPLPDPTPVGESTEVLQAVLPLPGEPTGREVDGLAAAISAAMSEVAPKPVVTPLPAPPRPAAPRPAAPGTARVRVSGVGYLLATAATLLVMIVLAVRSPGPAPVAPRSTAVVAPPEQEQVAPTAFAARLNAPQPPPPAARPEAVLAAFEAAVARQIEAGSFREALTLAAALSPDVVADPAGRARQEAARRRVEEAHVAAVAQQRRALADLVEQGDVARAREAARAAAAWAIDVNFSREVEVLVGRRDAELADLGAPPGLDVPRLELGLRSMIAGFGGQDSSLMPNGAISLDYGARHAALAEDLMVRAPPHALGVRIDAGALPILAVHRLPLANVLDATLEFVVLARPSEGACLALLLVDPASRDTLGHGITWDCEVVQLGRRQGLVRTSTTPGRPATPRVPYRLRLIVRQGDQPAIGGTVEERREDGWRLAAAPGPVPVSSGQLAVYARGVDVCVTSLKVRGVVDPARVPVE